MIQVLTWIYIFCAFFLAIFTLSQVVLLVAYVIHRRRATPLPEIAEFPRVAVQLPLYNEKHVVTRLLESVAALDYPREKLTVQVLDDSTDDTVLFVAEMVNALRREGLDIHHVRREKRTGYKAGALAYGCELLGDDVEFIAIIDADFVPPPDFLQKTIPYLVADPTLGILQTRWGHLNAGDNLLTRAQALAIDAHFVVEQTARNRSGLLLTFNGTGGIWRASCIRDAGGWSADTLTEDFDLSYRAQLKGWRYMYLPHIVVPGEVPPQIEAYKRQQARWAKGSTQVLFKLLIPVWRTPGLTPLQRFMAMGHLSQYLPHPFMVVLILLTVPLIQAKALAGLPLGILGVLGFFPPLMHLITQWTLNQPHRLIHFPMLMVLGTGLALNNARADIAAVVSVITGKTGEFVRTPKFAQGWQKSQYAVRGDWLVWLELALALYAAYGLTIAARTSPGLMPLFGLYVVSFGIVSLMGLRDRWLLRYRARRTVEYQPVPRRK